MVVLEIAGQTIIDTVQPYTSASASNPSVSVVTAGVQENIIAYLRSTGGTFSATSPAVAITTLPYSSYLEYQLALSPGSQTVGFTATTGKVSILAVALANTNPNSSTVNVRSFGSAGDGITDDTNSIQLALNAALSGDTVYFPGGTYFLNSAYAETWDGFNRILALPNIPFSITGDGPITLLTTPLSNCAVLHGYPGAACQTLQILTLSNLAIQCTCGYDSVSYAFGAIISGVSLTCLNVTFIDCFQALRYPENMLTPPLVLLCKGCAFLATHGAAGIAFKADAGSGYNQPSSFVLGGALTCNFVSCYANCLTDFTFSGVASDCPDSLKKPVDGLTKTINQVLNLNVTGCTIINNANEAIACDGGSTSQGFMTVNITGNVFVSPPWDGINGADGTTASRPGMRGPGCCPVSFVSVNGLVTNNTIVNFLQWTDPYNPTLNVLTPFHWYLPLSTGVVVIPNAITSGYPYAGNYPLVVPAGLFPSFRQGSALRALRWGKSRDIGEFPLYQSVTDPMLIASILNSVNIPIGYQSLMVAPDPNGAYYSIWGSKGGDWFLCLYARGDGPVNQYGVPYPM